MMNAKKISENGNETITLKDNISETIMDKSEELSLHFDNERKEMKETLEESIKRMEDKIVSLKVDMAEINFKNEDWFRNVCAKVVKNDNDKNLSWTFIVEPFDSSKKIIILVDD